MIENEILYKTVSVEKQISKSNFKRKKLNSKKHELKFRQSFFDILQKWIMEVEDPMLNFGYVVALLTAHLLVCFQVENLVARL